MDLCIRMSPASFLQRTADRVWNEPRTTSLGKRFRVRLQDNRDLFIDRSRTGQLELSIRRDIQLIARAAMAGQVGAAVVLDPATGSVLGLWSAPQFDPNHLSSHDLGAVTSDYEALSSDPNQPLLNRAEFQSYEIGSLLFTIVTAATAIEEGLRDFAVPPVRSMARGEGSQAIVHDAGACGGDLRSLLLTDCSPGWATIGTTQLVDKTRVISHNDWE